MSYFCTLDGKPGPDIATISGFVDFTRWARKQEGEELRHLADEGYSDFLPPLERELKAALKAGEPTESQRSIGEGILAALRDRGDAEVFVVTEGFGEATEPGAGDDDGEED